MGNGIGSTTHAPSRVVSTVPVAGPKSRSASTSGGLGDAGDTVQLTKAQLRKDSTLHQILNAHTLDDVREVRLKAKEYDITLKNPGLRKAHKERKTLPYDYLTDPNLITKENVGNWLPSAYRAGSEFHQKLAEDFRAEHAKLSELHGKTPPEEIKVELANKIKAIHSSQEKAGHFAKLEKFSKGFLRYYSCIDHFPKDPNLLMGLVFMLPMIPQVASWVSPLFHHSSSGGSDSQNMASESVPMVRHSAPQAGPQGNYGNQPSNQNSNQGALNATFAGSPQGYSGN